MHPVANKNNARLALSVRAIKVPHGFASGLPRAIGGTETANVGKWPFCGQEGSLLIQSTGIPTTHAKTTKNSFVFGAPQGFDVANSDHVEVSNRVRERIIRTSTLGTNNQGLQGPCKAGMRKSFG